MPAAKDKIPIGFRIWPGQHKAWGEAARKDARSLAAWIQLCCDRAATKAGFNVPPAPRKPRAKRARKA
ncbi:MAG TPA: hypothetical protein VGD80_15160 [Kofleriaceae bacterium]